MTARIQRISASRATEITASVGQRDRLAGASRTCHSVRMNAEELDQSAATVVALAEHFERLKQRANELIAEFHASTRGYFTPSEDEQTRQLLVSYWHARNALFELVSGLHESNAGTEDRRRDPRVVLTAYAGALALVDVARFLRHNFHHRPVVRAKLNEPEPAFGIPAGTYDLVQKSLTRPVHVWHLYHAMQFVNQHTAELKELCAGNGRMEAVLALVQTLQNQMDVTVERYVLTRVRVRAGSLREKLSRDLLGKALYSLQKCVSSLIADRYVRSGHQPALPDAIADEVERLLEPGDVIVVRKEHAFTNYFLPGYWPHAALYLGSTDQMQQSRLHEHSNIAKHWNRLLDTDPLRPTRVLESMKDGVRIRSLSNPFRSDAIAVIRPTLQPMQIAEAIGRGFQHTDKAYDFDFDFSRSDRLVCTEVVYRTYDNVAGIQFELTRRAGRLTLSAEDLLQMAVDDRSFRPIAVYCPALGPTITQQEEARSALQKTIGRKSVPPSAGG